MRSLMTTAAALAGAMLLSAADTARASTSTVLKANVPFAFEVNGQTLPAGHYLIQREDDSSPVGDAAAPP
ncbi:MAG TPA: hypothetical protein VEK56_06780 [Vicinamibacterales bacterium]|nr:hypothetical protein [Vicinamibacterales bacterium]